MTAGNERLLRALKQCFTPQEWEVLTRDRTFGEAYETMKNLDDVERVAKMGNDVLLSASGHGGARIPRQRPESN